MSCGIPDFRSRDGIYARLSKDFPDLPDPQSMFDIHYFRRDQRPFFKFAKVINKLNMSGVYFANLASVSTISAFHHYLHCFLIFSDLSLSSRVVFDPLLVIWVPLGVWLLSDVSYSDKCRTKKYFKYAENMFPLFFAILMFSDSKVTMFRAIDLWDDNIIY